VTAPRLDSPARAEWEAIIPGPPIQTFRLAVEGGWIYLMLPLHGGATSAFVPDPGRPGRKAAREREAM
jgi:hypothetical protein